MIDLGKDTLVTMAGASKLLPGRPSVSTLWRWSRGLRGVRLATILVGGKRYTSREALQEFCVALTVLDRERSLMAPAVAASLAQSGDRSLEQALDRELR